MERIVKIGFLIVLGLFFLVVAYPGDGDLYDIVMEVFGESVQDFIRHVINVFGIVAFLFGILYILGTWFRQIKRMLK